MTLNETHNTSAHVPNDKQPAVEITPHNRTIAIMEECAKEIQRASLQKKVPRVLIKRSANISRSYPKVSQSRKIENINIVFPPKSKLENTNETSSEMTNISDDSLEVSCVDDESPEKLDINFIKQSDSYVDTPNSKTLVERTIDKTTMKPYTPERRNLFGTSPVSPLRPWTDFKLTYAPTPQNSPVSLNSIKTTLDKKSPLVNRPTSPTPPPEDNDEDLCDDCKANLDSNISNNKYPVRNINVKARRTLMSIDENTEMHSSDRPVNRLSLGATQETTKLDRVGAEKGLAHEIIEELQQKCKNTTNANYATLGSRNFVRKLVRVLEKSFDGDYEKLGEDNDYVITEEENQRNLVSEYSNVGSPSTIQSMSISIKDNASEASTQPDYNWSRQVLADIEKLEDQSLLADENEDDGVIWIPVEDPIDMPRTSSMRSDLSTWSRKNKSPSLSPIRNEDNRRNMFDDRKIMCNNRHVNNLLARQRLRTGGNSVADFGYSDRSEPSSAMSSFSTEWDRSDTLSAISSFARPSRFSANRDRNPFISDSIKV